MNPLPVIEYHIVESFDFSLILYPESNIVLFYFIGHNFGSEHDPETDTCAPSDYDDGKYIMYPWAVSGYDDNNLVSILRSN